MPDKELLVLAVMREMIDHQERVYQKLKEKIESSSNDDSAPVYRDKRQ